MPWVRYFRNSFHSVHPCLKLLHLSSNFVPDLVYLGGKTEPESNSITCPSLRSSIAPFVIFELLFFIPKCKPSELSWFNFAPVIPMFLSMLSATLSHSSFQKFPDQARKGCPSAVLALATEEQEEKLRMKDSYLFHSIKIFTLQFIVTMQRIRKYVAISNQSLQYSL